MAKTKAAIATMVLQKIGRLPDGQVAPGSQTKIVKEAYDALYQELLGDQIVDWSSTASIPEKVVYPIVEILSGRVSDSFGVPNTWSTNEDYNRKRIAKNLANPYVPSVTEFESL